MTREIRRGRRIVGACTLAVGLGVGVAAAPAMAAPSSSSDVGRAYQATTADVQQSQLTDLYTKLQAGTISPETYAAAEQSFARTTGAPESAPTTSLMPPPDIPPPPPAARTLSVHHYAQNKSYWCGPASGAMVVKMINGGKHSNYNNATFTQGHFAGPDHMRTEANGSTSWASGNFVRGVNRWLGPNYYQQVHAPSVSKMKSALKSTIGTNGRPLAADTVEFAGGKHYNGHPTGSTIGHWIVAYGYSKSGATVKWADPSTSVWSGVSKTFSANTKAFTNNFLQSNGIAY